MDDFVSRTYERMDRYGIAIGKPQPNRRAQLALRRIQFANRDGFL
jgi:hypothetical protein